jgi:hypothetical protein
MDMKECERRLVALFLKAKGALALVSLQSSILMLVPLQLLLQNLSTSLLHLKKVLL